MFISYPDYIWFDGELTKSYDAVALTKIAMLSSDFKNFSWWTGENEISKQDEVKIVSGIEKAHQSGKTVRFWDAPDNSVAWRKFIELNADFINTDEIETLTRFLESLKKNVLSQKN